MEECKKSQNGKRKIGGCNYLNKNCWIVKNLNYAPYKRCQYCEFKFHQCLFLQYQVVSLLLLVLSFSFFLLFEKRLSLLAVIVVFVLIIVYGYFFNSSTEKIIKSNFSLKKAKDALKDLTDNLKDKVSDQTKDIQEKSRYLQELLNIKTDFLRVANHQLNTPISVVLGAFSMMDEKIWDTAKSLETIKAGFKRIAQTVQDFWDAYELEGEKMEMKPIQTDITAIVEKLILEKQKMPLAIQRKLYISVSRPSFKIPPVWCDSKKITHVISNLLDNAIYYTEQGGVTISYELIDSKYFKINVTDTGAGISEDDKKILFQKFSRGRGASSLHPDGSGLGLYISKKIIEGNNGEMTCISKGAGKGSTFSFTVPIYRNQQLNGEQADQMVKKDKIMVFEKNNPV
ncbi:MAG: Signal transduction histidine kinase [Parcubacteria group bacterium Athens1014_10]|nr:MAG: Signal transduction histidine kinase [Parcubacteria group bacterium Athens1014_10]TSD05978.1 MAG: Signal transduction histidine kinase [Parcubacteria group bacterium Athens0714_12]